MGERRPHWLQPGGATKTPDVVVSFDTETRTEVKSGREVLTLRCWDAVVRHRRKAATSGDVTMHWDGETPAQLANVLTAAVAVTGEAWCFAHNAGFDLTVTSLPMVLAGWGWEPVFVNLTDETCVFVLKGETGRLVITDSWSWLRCSLETAAKDIGRRKVKLPDEDDSLAAWHHRCRHDVEILDELLATLLDWWDAADCGAFAVTGSSCGWRTMRRQLAEKTVLVGAEQPRTAFERSAIYSGRKEVYRVGRTRGRWVEDWDLTAAHLTTVAGKLLPAHPIRGDRITPPLSPLAAPYGLGAICTVEITTRRPCAPVRVGDDVWWPVGRFRTVLTTPELAAVVELADQVEIVDAQWYRLTDGLQPWANWCLGLMGAPDEQVPRVVKRVAKGWGRAVPGRFALRTSKLLREAPATQLGWGLESGHDLGTGEAIETITYGGVARTYRKDQDGADCSPAVLAFVEGYVRQAMCATLAARDPGLLLQCNTDGWWEIRAGRTAGDAAGAVPGPYRAALKARTRDVTIHGPNHLDSRDDRRLAGVPKDAKLQLDGSYAWQDWPGLRWQLQFSRPGEYVRPGREMLLADHYCRRWVLTTGETVPVSCRVAADGRSELLAWSQTAYRQPGDELAAWQVPALQPLTDPDSPWVYGGGASLLHLPGRQQPPQLAS